jgi:hypothetical protein
MVILACDWCHKGPGHGGHDPEADREEQALDLGLGGQVGSSLSPFH